MERMKLNLPLEVLEEKKSPVNGPLQVISRFGKVSILASGLTQSGGVMESVYKTTFARLKKEAHPKSVLILGFGAGTAARIISQTWPGVKITGVDLDPVMVELGKRYMGVADIANLEISIEDAQAWVKRAIDKGLDFDLVLVDIYQGEGVPPQFDRVEFFRQVKKLIAPGGLALFNRLVYNRNKNIVPELSRKLHLVFSSIKTITPEANILFFCYP